MWDHFLGSLNDQTILFWFAWWRDNYQYFEGNSLNYSYLYGAPYGWVVNYFPNQWLIWSFYFLLAHITNPILAFNLLTILTVTLIAVCSYFYFRHYFSKTISYVSALMYLTSSYTIYKATNHIDLLQFWVIPLFLLVYTRFREVLNLRYLFLTAFILALTTFISNYYAFFLLLYILVYELYKILIARSFSERFKVITTGTVFIVTYGLMVLPFLYSYLILSATDGTAITGNKINRPIDDYVTFSARPWHYILPSSDNPLVGGYTVEFQDWLESKNYFLFNNYFPKEHGAIYLGLGNVLLLLATSFYLLTKKFPSEVKSKVKYLVFAIIGLVLISMPPFFTVNGVMIYLPSYLLYKTLPLFRVTSRLFVIIYLLVLTTNGFLLEHLKNNLRKNIFVLCVALLFCVQLLTIYVPIKITDVSRPPEMYSYIATTTPKDAIVLVYTYSKTNEFLYWMQEHQRAFANPRDYCNSQYCSDQLTKNLTHPQVLHQIKNASVDYILVVGDRDLEMFREQITNKNLAIAIQIEDYYLIKIL